MLNNKDIMKKICRWLKITNFEFATDLTTGLFGLKFEAKVPEPQSSEAAKVD